MKAYDLKMWRKEEGRGVRGKGSRSSVSEKKERETGNGKEETEKRMESERAILGGKGWRQKE